MQENTIVFEGLFFDESSRNMSSYKKMETGQSERVPRVKVSTDFPRKNPLHCDPSPPPRLFSFPFFRSNLRTRLFRNAY